LQHIFDLQQEFLAFVSLALGEAFQPMGELDQHCIRLLQLAARLLQILR
jgi:hypothetical protein